MQIHLNKRLKYGKLALQFTKVYSKALVIKKVWSFQKIKIKQNKNKFMGA